MKIYPYLSDRREINETDVKYVETCNFKNAWDSSDSLNVYSWMDIAAHFY